MQSKLNNLLALCSEAEREAGKYNVPSAIHADDFIYQNTRATLDNPDDQKGSEIRASEYYFSDGDNSARRVNELVNKHHKSSRQRPLSFLEFASGYGCVSRHLRKMNDRYELTACDIHPQAISFLKEEIEVNALLSVSDPNEFRTEEKYDVVFALSFFSHMPDRTFGAWIKALAGSLANNGVLIFTTHGRSAHNDMGQPVLCSDGYWFLPSSEQKDLPTEEYGLMISTPRYVTDRISMVENTALISFEDDFWWGKQNLYVARKMDSTFDRR